MKLVLLRHGEREHGASSNSPLSSRGVKQALNLIELIKIGRFPAPQRLQCSPKLRTQMTLGPLADELKLPLQILPELDERLRVETADKFARRVRATLAGLEQTSGVVYICTHLDWLEVAMHEISSDTDLTKERYQGSWSPGHAMIFETSNQPWIFEKMETLPI